MLCQDAARIVVEYLDLWRLENFFVDNKLNFNMKFRWRGIGCGQYVNNMFDYVLDLFPGMMLMNVHFINGYYVLDKYLDRMGKLLCCKIFCRYLNLVLLNNNKLLDKISDVRMLELDSCYRICVDVLRLKKVKYIILGNDNGILSPHLGGLSQWSKLKKVVISDGLNMRTEDFYELSLCPNLIYLDINIYTRDDFVLNCKKLRVLKIRNYNRNSLGLVGGCKNLEKLVIKNCDLLNDMSALVIECPNLRYLVIQRKGGLNPKDECVLRNGFVNLRIKIVDE